MEFWFTEKPTPNWGMTYRVQRVLLVAAHAHDARATVGIVVDGDDDAAHGVADAAEARLVAGHGATATARGTARGRSRAGSGDRDRACR